MIFILLTAINTTFCHFFVLTYLLCGVTDHYLKETRAFS